MSYKRQELLTLCEYLSSSPPQFLYEDRDAYLFIFSVVLLCVFPFLVPCCDVCYDFHIIRLNLHLFVCGLMSYYVFCVRVRIVMSNILLLLIFLVFCVVCLFRFHCPRAVSCVPNVARLSVLSTLDCVLCFFSRLFISVSLKLMGGGFLNNTLSGLLRLMDLWYLITSLVSSNFENERQMLSHIYDFHFHVVNFPFLSIKISVLVF